MNYDLSILEKDYGHIKQLIYTYFACDTLSAQKVGKGFYGVVYLININKDPGKVILKVYKHSGRNQRECQQLDLLRRHSLLKIPQVYYEHNYSEDIPFDALLMEYIDGVNAARLPTDHPNRDSFADEMVGNLVHLHGITNEDRFGFDNEIFPDWKSCLGSRVSKMHSTLHSDFKDKVSPNVMAIADKSFDVFASIFAEPVLKPSLIHSDYNLWNILVDEKSGKIKAVIDPLDAGWADREMDLFHLQNADGDRFELLERYRRNVKLSELFEVKNAFYWFWDDIKHMENMGWYNEERFTSFGNRLINLMKEYGIEK